MDLNRELNSEPISMLTSFLLAVAAGGFKGGLGGLGGL